MMIHLGKAVLFLVLAAPFCSQLLTAQEPAAPEERTTEFRKHFVAAGPRGANVLYTISEVNRLRDSEDRKWLLMEDPQRNAYVFRSVYSYKDQTVEYQIVDLKRKAHLRSTTAFPFKGRTRQETITEARENPKILESDERLTIETNGVTITAKVSEWRGDEQAREWRSQIRQSLDPVFLEGLERMRDGLLLDPLFGLFRSALIGNILHGNQCSERPSISLWPAEPDCSFDASFGFACSDKQKERVERAREEHKLLQLY